MTDDIVNRLRYEIEACNTCICSDLIEDAADEIERLRKAGDQLAYWALQENLAGELISAAKAWKAVSGD